MRPEVFKFKRIVVLNQDVRQNGGEAGRLNTVENRDDPTQLSPRGATTHAGYSHRFHLFKPVSGSYHATPTPSGDGSDVVDDRTRDYEGPFPLDRPRWQLPNGPTFFQYQYQLVQAPMGADSSPSVGARRCDLDGRR